METDNKKRPLGYAMKIRELNKLFILAVRLKEQVRLADENRVKLQDAISMLIEVSSKDYQEALIYLKRDIDWMCLVLDTCKDTSKNIEKRINGIITLKQTMSAKKSIKAQEETINKTFSKE